MMGENSLPALQLDVALCRSHLYDDAAFWQACGAAGRHFAKDEAMCAHLANLAASLARGDRETAEHIATGAAGYAAWRWPAHAPMAPAWLLGLLLPPAVARFRAAGAGEDVTRATFGNFGLWAASYGARRGRPGVDEISWLLLPFLRRIWKIGRLQFETALFAFPFYVFEDSENGRFAALAQNGLELDGEGRINGTNGCFAQQPWKAGLALEDGHAVGHPVNLETACVLRQPVRLALARHRLVLAPGRPVLNLHIPAGESFATAAVEDSLARGAAYFRQLGFPCAFAVCESWLLDPGLEQYAAHSGNILHFMRRFHKLPEKAAGPSIGRYLFGLDITWQDVPAARAATGLQKSLQAHIKAGGRVYDTAGFIKMPEG